MNKTQAMSKTFKNTNLGAITGVFLFFLTLIGINTFNEAYIQLKHSVVDEHIHAVLFYSLELAVLLFVGYGVCKVISNINKRKFFVKINYMLFYYMGVALFFLPVLHELGDALDTVHDWKIIPMEVPVWSAMGTFLLIIAEIFRYGIRMKEEQDLTV